MLIISKTDIAEYLGISYKTIKEWSNSGKLPKPDASGKVFGNHDVWTSECLDKLKSHITIIKRKPIAKSKSNRKCQMCLKMRKPFCFDPQTGKAICRECYPKFEESIPSIDDEVDLQRILNVVNKPNKLELDQCSRCGKIKPIHAPDKDGESVCKECANDA